MTAREEIDLVEIAPPWWLIVWANWNGNDDGEIRKLMWYPSKTPILVGGWARGGSFWEDEEDRQHAALAEAVDSSIDDLPAAQKAAIEWVMEIQRVAKPARLDQCFALAIEALEMSIRKKGALG